MASVAESSAGPRTKREWKRPEQGTYPRRPKPVQGNTRARPTHFVAIPMNTNRNLRNRVAAFQSQLLSARDTEHAGWVKGLHPSIVINPIRFHLTVAVMGLHDDTKDTPAVAISSHTAEASALPATLSVQGSSTVLPKQEQDRQKTVSQALDLLRSIKPKIHAILYGSASPTPYAPNPTPTAPPLRVRLDHMEVMRLVKPPKTSPPSGTKTASSPAASALDGPASVSAGAPSGHAGAGAAAPLAPEMWADVLYLAPREDTPEGIKLRQLGDLINSTFRKAGYLTDTRPLKFHCTVLNTSHRKPSRDRKLPFCYSDILLHEEAWKSLFASPSPSLTSPLPPALGASTSGDQDGRTAVKLGSVPHPLKGPEAHDEWMEIDVREVGLWKMGSHAKDGSYVSCGGIRL